MQNFRTYTVNLDQSQYELVRQFTSWKVEDAEERLLSPSEYKVVDVYLRDGRALPGLIVFEDDMLLVPEYEPEFADRDILRIEETPKEDIPDFTITDTEQLWEKRGKSKSIEDGNMLRKAAFGPKGIRDPGIWRTRSVEACHTEALRLNRDVRTYSGELPPSLHGVGEVRLVPGGVEMRIYSASREKGEKYVIRPTSPEIWADILNSEFEIDEETTFGDLLNLLDLPENVGEEVYLRCMPYRRRTFERWVKAGQEEPRGSKPDIEYLEVAPFADEWDGTYHIYYHTSGVGRPLEQEEEYYKVGERISWSLMGVSPAFLVNSKLRYNPEIKIPVLHEEREMFMRGTRREWERGGREGEAPQMPMAFSGKLSIILKDFICAVFTEVAPYNYAEGEFLNLILGDEEDDLEETI